MGLFGNQFASVIEWEEYRLSLIHISIAKEWYERGKVSQDFLTYLQDETQVAFPWTMIDKITPRPAQSVERELESLGLEGIYVYKRQPVYHAGMEER